MKFHLTFFFFIGLYFSTTFITAQDSRQKPDAKMIKVLVDSLSNALNREYIYADKAKLMGSLLKKNLKNGNYNKTTNEMELAVMLDKDIHSIMPDRHLLVRFDPMVSENLLLKRTEEDMKKDNEVMLKINMADNFLFKKLEILSGNIGYVRWDGFTSFAENAKPVLDAAFSFISNCKALIIDMRYNGGGSPNMVLACDNYFFSERTKMNYLVNRIGDTVMTAITDPAKTNFKLTMPVYILTSKSTFSGAEDFTYCLKHSGRAVVVGDTTGGGAHPTAAKSLGSGFVIHLPHLRSWSPFTKTNWEGTGIYPDIYSPSELALEKTQTIILKDLLSKSSDPREKNTLQFEMNALEMAKYFKKQPKDKIVLSKEVLAKYCGDFYPDIKDSRLSVMAIILKDASLYRRIPGSEVELIPLSDKKFYYNDESGRNLEFVIDDKGNISTITLVRPDGKFTLTKKN